MKRSFIYPVIIIFLVVFFSLSYCRQQKRVRQVLSENARLLGENRRLQHSLDMNSNTAQQIADRQEIQERTNIQFVDRRTYFRRNWKQFITISTSDYRTGFLGGIKDLKVIVRNQTEYPLDNVVVTVEYLRGNDEVFKTEKYTVNNVSPKSTQSVNAASSRKGQKVRVKLESITSQPMNFCWTAGKPAPPGNPDPYLCTPD